MAEEKKPPAPAEKPPAAAAPATTAPPEAAKPTAPAAPAATPAPAPAEKKAPPAVITQSVLQAAAEAIREECVGLQQKGTDMIEKIKKLEEGVQIMDALQAEVAELHKVYLGLVEEDFKRRSTYFPVLALQILKKEIERLGGAPANPAPPAPAGGAAPAAAAGSTPPATPAMPTKK